MIILMIQTGGTMAQDYPRVMKRSAYQIGDPAVGRIMERRRPSCAYRVDSLMCRDSLQITYDDRFQIYNRCRRSQEPNILITHITDTTIKMGMYLTEGRRVPDLQDKKIIFNGAMRLKRFDDRDAVFNLGTACGAFIWAPAGVYGAMHGCLIPVQDADCYPETSPFYWW